MKLHTQLKEELKAFIRSHINENEKPVVTIISPYAFSEEERSFVLHKFPFLKGSEIALEVDPQIMAGCIIRFGSKMIDLSIRTELHTLTHKLYESA